MSRNHEEVGALVDPLAVVVNLGGPELLDKIHSDIRANSHTDSARGLGGIATFAPFTGLDVTGIGNFQPGYDQLDVPATLAAARPKAVKRHSATSLMSMHIAADLPRRLESSVGQINLRKLGRFTVAYGLVLAELRGARSVLTLGDDFGARELFDDQADAGYMAMMNLDGELSKDTPPKEDNDKSSLSSLLEKVNASVFPDSDVALLVSDFMAGFDPHSNKFDWEDQLLQLQAGLGDRLVAIRLASEAQQKLPLTQLAGIDIAQAAVMQQKYADLAAQKENALTSRLLGLRHKTIDLEGPEHPVRVITDFMHSE